MKLKLLSSALLLGLLAACASPAPAHRAADLAAAPQQPVNVRLLALNDFHGQLTAGRKYKDRPVGGAAVLAAWLRDAQRGMEERTLIVDAGDMVGASPLTSSLLHDEPTVLFLNQLANAHCQPADRLNPGCNMVGTLGNHEFDKGLQELLRLNTGGGNASLREAGQDSPWLGEAFPLVSANVVWADSGKPVLAPYVIKHLPYTDAKGHAGKLAIAFIGATVKGTPLLTSPLATTKLRFLDEAEAVNRYLPEIRAQGVHAVVLLIHEGGDQPTYEGPTDPSKPGLTGAIAGIVKRLGDDVAVVVSGHSHHFSNALLPNAQGEPVLVTQAFSYSAAFAKIDLTIDPASDRVVKKSAEVFAAYADAGPGLVPDAQAAALVAKAEAQVGPAANRLIARIPADVTRKQNRDGESTLGNLVADAQRAATGADFAFMNRGGIREDLMVAANQGIATLPAGAVTYRDLYAAQPFGNTVTKLTMTGQQIYDVLEQEFPPYRHIDGEMKPQLFISGLSYSWDLRRPDHKVVEVRKDGKPIDRQARYTVAVNRFLSDGGDSFSVFRQGEGRQDVIDDVAALEQYLAAQAKANGGLFTPPALGTRMKRLD